MQIRVLPPAAEAESESKLFFAQIFNHLPHSMHTWVYIKGIEDHTGLLLITSTVLSCTCVISSLCCKIEGDISGYMLT